MKYRRIQMEQFDLIIVGGGPGGYEAAELAGKSGLRTALIEKNKIGGTCLNQGCIPLKGYLHVAHIIDTAHELEKDNVFIDSNSYKISQTDMVKRNQSIISSLQQGIFNKLKNAGVSIFEGKGQIVSVNKEQVIVDINGLQIKAKYLILATGSQEVRIPINNNNLKYPVIYSNDMFNIQNIPKKMVIIGSGVIGLEAACYFNAAGCEITMLDASNKIGGELDNSISTALQKIMERKGVSIYTNIIVKEFCETAILIEEDGQERSLPTECVLIAIGRTPCVEGLGLKECNIRYTKDGICIDSNCRTNQYNVFACGDVTGKVMLAHTAYAQARIIIHNLTGYETHIDYSLIPKIIYTSPEVITIGLTEEGCIANNIPYMARELPMTYTGKYFVEHKKDGAKAKIIINPVSRTIIGFSMIGNGSAEIALTLELLMAGKMSIDDIANLIFPHPTVGEIIHELATTI